MTSKINVLYGDSRETGDDSWSILTTLGKSSPTTRISHISLTASKDGIILINSFHLKFRLLSCLSISWPLKQPSKNMSGTFSRVIVSRNFCKLLSKHLWWSLFLEKFNKFSIFFWISFDGYVLSMKTNLNRYFNFFRALVFRAHFFRGF